MTVARMLQVMNYIFRMLTVKVDGHLIQKKRIRFYGRF
jgi:hypothetical protein